MLRFRPLVPEDQEQLWNWLHIALWDPPREAYVTGHLAVGLAKGTIQLGEGKSFTVPNLGEFKFGKHNVVITGEPLVFTKENVGNYDF